MTLTELKYTIAVARERHFGRAAESCFVSQPSLSVAVKKLEDELGVMIFERRSSEISITPIGELIIEQAQKVLDEARYLHEIALQGQDPLSGPLRLGVIFTIAPYLLPTLVRELSSSTPKMPIYLKENYTHELLNQLRKGEIDVAIVADSVNDPSLKQKVLYQEDFVVAVPSHHPWTNRNYVGPDELKDQTMLLLGAGHCFRDQILGVCPELMRQPHSAEMQHTVEGSSLLTICHMVAQGLGITVLPASAVPFMAINETNPIKIIPFKSPVPSRQVMMVWRKSFTRDGAIEALVQATHKLNLNGCYFVNK